MSTDRYKSFTGGMMCFITMQELLWKNTTPCVVANLKLIYLELWGEGDGGMVFKTRGGTIIGTGGLHDMGMYSMIYCDGIKVWDKSAEFVVI